MHDVYLFAGFIIVEVTFSHVERWLEHSREKVRHIRHLSWCAWCIHPAVSDAAAHYFTHFVGVIVGH